MVNKDCIKQHVSLAQKGLERLGLAQIRSPALPPAPLSSSIMLTSVAFQELWAEKGRVSFLSTAFLKEMEEKSL